MLLREVARLFCLEMSSLQTLQNDMETLRIRLPDHISEAFDLLRMEVAKAHESHKQAFDEASVASIAANEEKRRRLKTRHTNAANDRTTNRQLRPKV